MGVVMTNDGSRDIEASVPGDGRRIDDVMGPSQLRQSTDAVPGLAHTTRTADRLIV